MDNFKDIVLYKKLNPCIEKGWEQYIERKKMMLK